MQQASNSARTSLDQLALASHARPAAALAQERAMERAWRHFRAALQAPPSSDEWSASDEDEQPTGGGAPKETRSPGEPGGGAAPFGRDTERELAAPKQQQLALNLAPSEGRQLRAKRPEVAQMQQVQPQGRLTISFVQAGRGQRRRRRPPLSGCLGSAPQPAGSEQVARQRRHATVQPPSLHCALGNWCACARAPPTAMGRRTSGSFWCCATTRPGGCARAGRSARERRRRRRRRSSVTRAWQMAGARSLNYVRRKLMSGLFLALTLFD